MADLPRRAKMWQAAAESWQRFRNGLFSDEAIEAWFETNQDRLPFGD
jgi:hypothetical protein